MDYEDNEYGENAVEDVMADYDYHINTGVLPELFDESSVDEFFAEGKALRDDIADLNDWD
ncbi:hypothetical protein [uncultured Duncaniella sp.]|uniref:hypothetical protein n=1 Tax=uncultured Duncaniella sp. TaxID=2768039 RepID=UPI002674502D|nr:hypothetical protein [uncultured Duncaniella sp.]